jgi:hypothetical protein
MIEHFYANLSKEELDKYYAEKAAYEAEQKRIAQEKKDKEWAKVWGPEEEKKNNQNKELN